MKQSEIVEKMCKAELTAADIKAISNARGFSLPDTRSPAHLESLLLSDVGLKAVFSTLEPKEIIMLHFLKGWKKPVDVAAFERMTGKRNKWHGTFNQQYGEVFKQIKTRLIRKGILVFATGPIKADSKTRLERQVFAFPSPFHADLPPLFPSAKAFPGPGEDKNAFIRNKLDQLIHPRSAGATDSSPWEIKDGELYMGDAPFDVDSFCQWQRRRWLATGELGHLHSGQQNARMSPMDALDYAFATLAPDEWIEPDDLIPVLKMFCPEKQNPNPVKALRHGWETACLVRQQQGEKTWYRPAPPFEDVSQISAFDEYFSADRAGVGLQVDLATIPLGCLEAVARISKMRITGGVLTAEPDMVRIGRVIHDIRDTRFARWLTDASHGFSQAFATASQRWGRQVVHGNLLVARVRDLGLKISLEKAFKDGKIIFLPGDFIAFPEGLRSRVEAHATGNGFAVKTIDHTAKRKPRQ
ncbi:hypothetical protein DSCO28_43090 [Desulfosarcina ovata subsp. sediminis]|uniref:Uncharacterized protein n=1 Tax=Desulfosarcina ovata subsp. sediminis TaxID=885957 RepID=A0A5K7ZU42_9BACT|nr:hypothetical protein [Desulfosarcina ovata]BBO83743.1 hypothetical protein DSCO28_43090 [Desulfosarcina ovata subsp. sediminis]